MSNKYGSTQWEVQPGRTLSQQRNGLFTLRESRQTIGVNTFAAAVLYFRSLTKGSTPAAGLPNLKLDTKDLRELPGGAYQVDLVFAGNSDKDTPDDEDLPDPVWSLIRTPTTEPIESNPEFLDFAGTPASPLNGARFDDDGLFLGFEVGDPNIWGGTSKYLQWAATVVKESVVTSAPSGEAIPRIETPTGSPFTLPTNTVNWLKNDLTITSRAGVFELREQWQMSGVRGWNSTLYPA